jgi:hypothetical protein
MEPLAALGLAANILQFVSFTAGLISKTKEISSSATGCSEEVLTIDKVYTRLRSLSVDLSTIPSGSLQGCDSDADPIPKAEAGNWKNTFLR